MDNLSLKKVFSGVFNRNERASPRNGDISVVYDFNGKGDEVLLENENDSTDEKIEPDDFKSAIVDSIIGDSLEKNPELKKQIHHNNELFERERSIDKMYTYMKGFLHGANMMQSLHALTYIRERHEGQKRYTGERYIIHPYRMASHAMNFKIKDDDLIATILTHDVVEDTGVKIDDLPFSEQVKRSVKYMTVPQIDEKEGTRKEKKSTIKEHYYRDLLEDANALICKGFDRYDNLSTIIEMPESSIVKNILETSIWLLPVLKKGRDKWPVHSDILQILRQNIRVLNNVLAFAFKVELDDEARLITILDGE